MPLGEQKVNTGRDTSIRILACRGKIEGLAARERQYSHRVKRAPTTPFRDDMEKFGI